MYALLLKDILIQKKFFLTTLGYSFFLLIFMGGQGAISGAYIMGSVTLIYLFVQNSCASDEKNNSEIIINSLPITRSSVVISKYLSSIIFIIFNLMIISITGYFLSLLNIGNISPITLQDAAIILPATLFFTAVFLPFFFKFGFQKSRYFTLFGFLFLVFGPSYLINFIMENPEITWVNRLLTFLENSPSWLLGLAGAAGAASLLLLSVIISIRFYKKRAF